MEKFNIITDWYFCQCIQAEPIETELFLSLSYHLFSEGPDARARYHCLGQLTESDIRMQIYSFPRIIQLFSRPDFEFPAVDGTLTTYFNNLLGIIPLEMSSVFKLIFKAVYTPNPDFGALLGHIKKAATFFAAQTAEKAGHLADDEPYLDLYESCPQVLLLSIYHLIAKQEPGLKPLLAAEGLLQQIVLQSLENKYGRLALLQAGEIALMVHQGLDQDQLLDAISGKGNIHLMSQPDIVAMYCKLQFLYGQTDPPAIIAALFQEYRQLRHYRQIYIAMRRDTRAAALCLTLWQTSLVTEAISADPAAATGQLGLLWHLSQQPVHTRITINDPFRNQATDKEIRDLLILGKVGIDKVDFDRETRSAWLYYSPFLFLRRQGKQLYQPWAEGNEAPLTKYVHADTENAWIGLASSFFNALRLLKTAPSGGDPMPLIFNDLIVHVYHVAADFRPWLKTIVQGREERRRQKEDKNILKLSLPLSALVLTCYRQISLLSSGYCPLIRPEHFIRGFHVHQRHFKKGEPLSDKTIFYQYIYPLTLTDWIYDAYLSAVPGNPTEAWIKLLPPLCSYINALDELGTILDKDDKVKAAVLMRYLTTAYHGSPAFDWRTVIGQKWKKPLRWKAPPNYFLLNDPALEAKEWEREWTVEPDETDANGRTTLLIRALERFVAVRSNNPMDIVGNALRQKWELDFRERIIRIKEALDVNRFVRLRLVEIVADDALWAEQTDLRELIVLLIFEFGGAYDLYRLATVLFTAPKGQHLPADAADQGLRELLIRVLFTDSSARLISRNSEPQVPDYFKIRTEASREEFLLGLKSLIAGSDAEWIRVMLEDIAKNNGKSLCRAQDIMRSAVPVFSNGRYSQLSEKQFTSQPAFQQVLTSLTYDINGKQAILHYRAYQKETLVNLFELSPAELAGKQAFNNVAAVYAGPLEADPAVGLFNCGLEYYLQSGLGGLAPTPGSPVRINRICHRQGRWEMEGWREITPDPQQPCQLLMMTAYQDRRRGLTRFALTNPQTKATISESSLADDLFFPDTSAFFSPPKPAYPVYCRLAGATYQPVPGRLADLLLESHPGELLTLAYISITYEEGRPGWLFSRLPGKTYTLFEDDFHQDEVTGAEVLRSTVAGLEHQNGTALGLLVSLTAVFIHYRYVLQLVSAPPGGTPGTPYTGPSCPFDFRNINWRQLFRTVTDEPDVFEEGGACFLRVDKELVPGFPAVKLIGLNPGDIGKEIAINAKDWKSAGQRNAEIKAEAAPFYTLCGGDLRQLSQFIPVYLNWAAGSRITVQRIIPCNWQEDGELLGFSREDVPLKLELESVTMRPVEEYTVWKEQMTAIRRRPAMISRITDWKPMRMKDNTIRTFTLLLGEEAMRNCTGEGDRLEGIIVEKPQDSRTSQNKGDPCKVAWITPAGILPEMIRLEGLNQLKYNPGCKIIASYAGGVIACTIYRRDIHVRALWEVTQSNAQPAQNDLFLFEDTEHAYYESEKRPGTIIAAAVRGKGQPKPATQLWDTFVNTGARFGRWQNRVVLVNNRQAYLAGQSGTLNGKYIRNVDYWLQPEGDQWQLTRNLILEGRLDLDASPQPVQEHRQLQDALLEAYFEASVVLKGAYDPVKNVVRPYPDDVFFRDNQWSALKNPAFKIGPGREPLVSGAGYDKDEAEFTLYRSGEAVWADFVQERNFRLPEQFKIEYDRRFSDASIFPLHYVGKRTLLQRGQNKEGYLFEWGYGKQLWVPEGQLSYNSGPTSRQPDLFPGDKVLGIQWSTIRQGPATILIVHIKSLQIDYCQSSLLYFQSKNQKVIHVLKVERTADDRMQIKEVMGFAERQDREAYYFQVGSPEFDLEDESTVSLLTRIRKDARPNFYLYARLNTDHYKRHHQIRFKLVNYEQNIGDRRNAGSLIPMVAKERVTGNNDSWLLLSPIEEQPGAPLIRLSRRNFSVRENLLGRLREQDLIGKIYFIALCYNFKGPYASLTDTPKRRKRVLADLVRSQAVVIAVAKTCNARTLEIELKPGVFTELSREDLTFAEWNSCIAGDRLYIRQLEGTSYPDIRFFVTLASRGDHSFITGQPRPCVLLPWNQLGNKKDFTGKTVAAVSANFSKVAFSAGGLPNIEAKLDKATYEEIRALMVSRHPKTAMISLQQDQPVISLGPDPHAGRLVIDPAGFGLAAELSDQQTHELRWEAISFAQCGIQELILAAGQHWRYHDDSTFHWQCGPDLVITGVQYSRIPLHNGKTGPLFFDQTAEGYRLRPAPADLLRFAFPVDTLIADLENRPGKTGRYAFAARTSDGRYWLELSPGRIAEFAPQLCFFSHTPYKLYLEHFTWNSLAPGDWLTLELAMSDPAEPEELRLLQWEPGYRDVLRHAVCHAPARVKDKGECLVGEGTFVFSVPTTRLPPGFAGHIAIDSANEISSSAALPKSGDTVFINDQMQVLGFPALAAIPGESAYWKADPLYQTLFPRDQFSPERFLQITAALGGAIPVTVQKMLSVDGRDQMIFTRRHQYTTGFIRDGQISLARLVGKLAGPDLLFQSGSELFVGKMQQLIGGVPAAKESELLDILKKKEIWIRKTGTNLQFGYKPENEAAEVKLEISGILSDGQSDRFAGLIGRCLETGRYYWMPKAQLAWARIPDDLLQLCYPLGSVARARLVSSKPGSPEAPKIASIVLTNAAVNEFRRFRIGSEIAVQPLAGNTAVQLVRTVSSGMILECENAAGDETKSRWLVEVIDKSDAAFPFYLLSCREGRKYRLDLPDMTVYDLQALQSFSDHRNRLADTSREVLQVRLAEILEKQAEEAGQDPDLQADLVLIYQCLTLYPGLFSDAAAEKAAEIAYRYTRLIQRDPCIHLSYAVLALLIISGLAQHPISEKYHKAALALTRNICRRSVRSLHVPAILRELVIDQLSGIKSLSVLAASRNIYERLLDLQTDIKKKYLDEKALLKIIYFCGLISYRGSEARQDIELLANALLTAAGYQADISLLLERNPVHSELLKLYAIWNRHGQGMRLTACHQDILKAVLAHTVNYPVILMDDLLPPV